MKNTRVTLMRCYPTIKVYRRKRNDTAYRSLIPFTIIRNSRLIVNYCIILFNFYMGISLKNTKNNAKVKIPTNKNKALLVFFFCLRI